ASRAVAENLFQAGIWLSASASFTRPKSSPAARRASRSSQTVAGGPAAAPGPGGRGCATLNAATDAMTPAAPAVASNHVLVFTSGTPCGLVDGGEAEVPVLPLDVLQGGDL